MAAVQARWLLVSYSTDGNIPVEGLLNALARRGCLTVFTQRYKRYRVSTPRMSPRPHTVEFLAVVDTGGRRSARQVDRWMETIRDHRGHA